TNDGDCHRLGRANSATVGDRHVIFDGKLLPGGGESEGEGRGEGEGNRAGTRPRVVGHRGRERTRQKRIYPARRRHPERPAGRGHARARRVVVGEVDVGEDERAGGLDGLDGRVRTQGIRCQHRRVVAAGDGDRHRLGQADPEIVGDRHVVGDGKGLAGGEEIEDVVGGAERGGDRPTGAYRAVDARRGGQRRRQHSAQPARKRGDV